MGRHLKSVDDTNAADLSAIANAFDWAADALGFMPDEIAHLLRPEPRTEASSRNWGRVVESRVRNIVGIAADVCALLGDPDEVQEWLRSPNPGLWSDDAVPIQLTPAEVMLNYEDGVRSIRAHLRNEHHRRFASGWTSGQVQ